MDELLRESAWGWTEIVLQAMKNQPSVPHSSRSGWRSHRLRAQSIHDQIDPDLWRDSTEQEPRLTDLLSSMIGPDPERACERRLEVGSPGLRADAACDRSWLAWKAGDHAKAASWASRAREIHPKHIEAENWHRLLRSMPLPSGRSAAQMDQQSLCPRQGNAWLSPERWRRRGLSGRWTRPAPVTTALFTLQERGVHTRLLANEGFWMDHPHDHPAVDLESLVDRVLSATRSLRPASIPAWQAWELASRLGPRWVSSLACFLARLALRVPSLLRIGLLASGVACRLHPSPPFWHAVRARLLAECGQARRALQDARSLLRNRDPVIRSLAISTLKRLGHHREAQRASRIMARANWF
jgi:hypothetical protein